MAFQTQYEITNKSAGFPLRRAVFAYRDSGGEEQYLEDIDIKFRINAAGNTILPTATISVCNLNTDVMKYLTTIMPMNNNREIALYVGRESSVSGEDTSALPLLYKGMIMQSYFTMPPDIWLEMSCLSSEPIYTDVSVMQEVNDYDYDSIKGYIIRIVEACGLAAVWDDDNFNDAYLKQFPLGELGFKKRVGASPIEVLRYLQNAYNLQISFYGDKAYITPSTRFIQVSQKEPNEAKWVISKSTGMIGIPTVSTSLANVVVLMNPALAPTDVIDIQSERLKGVYVKSPTTTDNGIAANGIYTINVLEHAGHLRGNEFYTNILANRGSFK